MINLRAALTPTIVNDRSAVRAQLASFYPVTDDGGILGMLKIIDEADSRALDRRVKGTFQYWKDRA